MSIGSRLREEREKIGYSQQKLGSIGGVQKRAQINYEAGERQPDAAYLRGVAQIGVDVQYVLLGVRSANLMDVMLSDEFVEETNTEKASSGPSQQAQMSDEQLLLETYRRCKPEGRLLLIQTAALLSTGLPVTTGVSSAPAPTSGATQVFHGTVRGDLAGRDIHKNKVKK